jgi:hypothetical protein
MLILTTKSGDKIEGIRLQAQKDDQLIVVKDHSAVMQVSLEKVIQRRWVCNSIKRHSGY